MEHRELKAGEREQNVVLQFKPQPAHDVHRLSVFALDRSEGADFGALPPSPMSRRRRCGGGHDRCIINLKPEHVEHGSRLRIAAGMNFRHAVGSGRAGVSA